MTNTSRRRPRAQLVSTSEEPSQQTMDGNYRYPSSTFQSQKFALNSFNRVVARKGLGKKPTNPGSSSEIVRTLSGRKCSDLDLATLTQSFANYRKAVNMILEKVFSDIQYSQSLGKQLDECRGLMYLVLRKERRLKWNLNAEIRELVYERMHRNALEVAARIIHSDYTRRKLVNALLGLLVSDKESLVRLVTSKRIPSDIVRKLKNTIEKRTDGSYHYALSACRQVRSVLRINVQEFFPLVDGRRRLKSHELLEQDSPHRIHAHQIITEQVCEWNENGFPFIIPTFQKDTIDFVASTENTTVQGYWFTPDSNNEDEIILYIKTPPGVLGHETDSKSPYKSQTIRLRFLNWFPRKAKRARRKAQEARDAGDLKRAVSLEFRAERFEDMNQQLSNTMKVQCLTRELAKERAQEEKNAARIEQLLGLIDDLKESRSSAPPVIKMMGKKATLVIPFMSSGEKILQKMNPVLGKKNREAGVDRGLRHSMVVSVKNGEDDYTELMIGRQDLFEKRERLRQRTRVLMSNIARRRNNWERKHPGQQPPVQVLKKERELESVWQKVRRLDREISHQVASEAVWFCENHDVDILYFEDLRSFQGTRGMRTHSWNLSTNLWGQMIANVRYRRESLGHIDGGIRLVNPAWTSQTCHVCGERGVRVSNETSIVERKGGEYFHCSKCDEHFHADVNAARNIIHVQSKPSAVSGRTA